MPLPTGHTIFPVHVILTPSMHSIHITQQLRNMHSITGEKLFHIQQPTPTYTRCNKAERPYLSKFHITSLWRKAIGVYQTVASRIGRDYVVKTTFNDF